MSRYRGQVALFFIFVVIAMMMIGGFLIYVWNYFQSKKIEARIELFIQTTDKGRDLSVLLGKKDVKPFMEMLGNRFAKGSPPEERSHIQQVASKLNYGLAIWSTEQYGEEGSLYEIFGTLAEEERDPNVKLEWPVLADISSPFGYRMLDGRSDVHGGIDFSIPIGTPVRAAADGIVVHVYDDCPNVKENINCITAGEVERQAEGCECNQGLGNYIVIEHIFGTKTYYTFYVHLDKVDVAVGKKVVKGEIIAKSGNSGYTTGPHLHFELADGVRPDFIKNDAYAKNPCIYLEGAPPNCVSQQGYVVAKFRAEIPLPGAREDRFKTMVGIS